MSGKAPKPDCLHLAINHTAAVGFKHLPGQINFISLRVLVIITGKTCIGRIQHILHLPCSHLLKHDPAVWDGFVDYTVASGFEQLDDASQSYDFQENSQPV